MFEFKEVGIEGVKLITPFFFEDGRGILKKTFEKRIFLENGIELDAMEELETTSKKGVLRGLHFQTEHSQGKLIRVAKGKIYDVAVDLRENSSTFGKYFGTYLSFENKKMLYIPAGFAHGCLILEQDTTFYYLCSQSYYAGFDSGIIWNDTDLNIKWPLDEVDKVILSEKDANLQTLDQYINGRQTK